MTPVGVKLGRTFRHAPRRRHWTQGIRRSDRAECLCPRARPQVRRRRPQLVGLHGGQRALLGWPGTRCCLREVDRTAPSRERVPRSTGPGPSGLRCASGPSYEASRSRFHRMSAARLPRDDAGLRTCGLPSSVGRASCPSRRDSRTRWSRRSVACVGGNASMVSMTSATSSRSKSSAGVSSWSRLTRRRKSCPLVNATSCLLSLATGNWFRDLALRLALRSQAAPLRPPGMRAC